MVSRQRAYSHVVGEYGVHAQMVAPDNGHSTAPLLICPQHFLCAGLFGGIDVAQIRR